MIKIFDLYLMFYTFLVFIFGGTLQIFGILSNSQSTFMLLVCFIVISISKIIITKKIKIYPVDYIFLALSFLIIVSGFINKSKINEIIFYHIYVLVPFVAYRVSKRIKTINMERKIFNILPVFIIIQIPIIFLQRLLYENFGSIYPENLSGIDVGFGTFFMADDVALGFLVNCFILFIIFHLSDFYSSRKKLAIVVLSVFVIFYTNSKISQIFSLMIVAFYFYFSFSDKTKKLVFFFVTISLIIFTFQTKNELDFENILSLSKAEQYIDKANSDGELLPRFSPLAIFIYQPTKIFGDGPYNFYNPISKKWKYNSGHSQLFGIYNDLGVVGVLMFVAIVFFIVFEKKEFCFQGVLYVSMFLLYSVVTSTFSDLSIMLTYNFFANPCFKPSLVKI